MGSVLKTTIDLKHVRDVAAASCNAEIKVSTDPGRYLCEYIYFKSLHATEAQCAAGVGSLAAGPTALFVHVPSNLGQTGAQCSLEALVHSLGVVVQCCVGELQKQSMQVHQLVEILGLVSQTEAASLLRANAFSVDAAANTFFELQERRQHCQSMAPT